MIVPILYRWLALIALMLASAGYGAMAMHNHDAKRYDSLLNSVKAEGQKQIDHSAAVVAKQKDISNETTKAYDKRLADLRRFYAGRVPNNSGCGNLSAIPATASTVDETTANNVPDTGNLPSVDRLPEQCAETTLQLITLQDWITKQAGNK